MSDNGSHSHHHHHAHGVDVLAEANKKFFNDMDYKEVKMPQDPEFDLQNFINKAVEAVLSRYAFNKESTTVMDFACNIGLFTRGLEPYTKLLIGVDISEKPVELFNKYVKENGISSDKMKAVCTELKGVEGELDGLKFDVITCSASYHHFTAVEEITKTLAFFLKPGGVLFVVDNTPRQDANSADPSIFPQEFGHVVAHTNGFTEKEMKDLMEGAGLDSFVFERIMDFQSHGRDATLFISQARKPLKV
ncbi:putative methyltransferase C1347.09 [Psilocybe cubensis]|uniref:Methyltransferase C1347.09 n=2 Tax=Psilocybe cubensis TaxID=181762 RepID=A0ACB8GRQ9_PSICU|nr:putative methyltransferase C1347.09 [Psilocybe cubensis]KAH9477724.1 putative methyltransferase C1347.09 [Psilocybe cubensis]